jgi:hypothetical protein
MFFYSSIPLEVSNEWHVIKIAPPIDNRNDAREYINQVVRPWLEENIQEDCFCELCWSYRETTRGLPANIEIQLSFSCLSDAALCRLKF